MRGDFSRFTHDPAKRFTAVRFEHGRMLSDADLNEAFELALARLEAAAADLVGPSGTLAEPPVAFRFRFRLPPAPLERLGAGAVATTGRAVVGRGTRFTAEGLGPGSVLLVGEQSRTVERVFSDTFLLVSAPFEPDLPAAGSFQITPDGNGGLEVRAGRYYVGGLLCQLERDSPLAAQADLPGYAVPSVDGRYLAYLEAWEREEGMVDEPLLSEPALLGPDTALRTRVVAQVKLAAAGANAVCADFSGWSPLPPPLSLAARSTAPPLDDRLYRVEIHRPGPPGVATFKWSRDNAAAVAPVVALGPGEITVAPPNGLAGEGAFAAGQWLEVSDERRSLAGEAGVLVQLARVTGQVLGVESWPGGTPPVFGDGATVRRWDSPGEVALAVAASGELWLPLEGGLEVRFAAPVGTAAAVGDAWLLPLRRASGRVLWPTVAGVPALRPPQSPRHRFAALAVVERSAGRFRVVSDCRRLFAAAAEPPNDDKLDRVAGSPPDRMSGPLLIASDLTVGAALHAGGTTVPASGVSLQVSGGDLLVPAGEAGGALFPPLSVGGAGASLRFTQAAGAPAVLTLGITGGAADRLVLRHAGQDRLIVQDGRVGIGAPAGTGFALDVAGAMRASSLRVEGPVTLAGGLPAAGALLTADGSGLATWIAPPSQARGRPVFFPTLIPVGNGSGPLGETTFTFAADAPLPNGAAAVILEAEAESTVGDGLIVIFTDTGGSRRLLLRARAAADEDVIAWSNQGAFPLNGRSFRYEVTPTFGGSWVIRAIGYYP